MGVNNSSENSNNNLLDDQNISDYYGLETSNSEGNESTGNISKINFDTDKSGHIKDGAWEKPELIPTTFEWDNEGTNVYVTGNFCGWNQFFLMKKNPQGSFTLTLDLPRGNHQYKFKVDNEWKCNEKFPTCENNGFLNNCLDTTNWEIAVRNTDEGTTTVSNTTENHELSKISKKKSAYIKMTQYSDYIPSKEEFREKIPEVPNLYKDLQNIDLLSNQNYIGKRNCLQINEDNVLSGNLAYKNIKNIHHEQINHFNSYKKVVNNNKTIICSTTSRYRNKFTTFVYYVHKKEELNGFNQ